jgi:hypothetical protein
MNKSDEAAEAGGEKMEAFNLAPARWDVSGENHSHNT